MVLRLLAGLALSIVAVTPALAQTVSIDHAAVGCVVAERFPRLEARFVPGDAVAKAKVLFQPEGARHWYAVGMKSEGTAFSGILPKPKKSLKGYRYYIEVTDRSAGVSRTPEYTTAVADGPVACRDKVMAGALGSASVALEVPAGAPVVPVGFASNGISTTAVAGGAGASAGGGGGLPTAVLIGGGVAAAGAAAVVVLRANKSYLGTFSGELIINRTNPNCSTTLALRGSVDIALDQSDGTVSGHGYGVISEQTVTARTGPCTEGARIGDTITGPITGTPASFMFGEPERLNPTAGEGQCGGGRMFVGAVNGDMINGTLTLTTFCVGSSPVRGETAIPVTLRR
jgi:hypothetical protein